MLFHLLAALPMEYTEMGTEFCWSERAEVEIIMKAMMT